MFGNGHYSLDNSVRTDKRYYYDIVNETILNILPNKWAHDLPDARSSQFACVKIPDCSPLQLIATRGFLFYHLSRLFNFFPPFSAQRFSIIKYYAITHV